MAALLFKRSIWIKMAIKAFLLRNISARKNPGIEMKPFIVTGPPRSGTSLLSALLARKTNVLVANEPVVVSDPCMEMGAPARLLRGYMVEMARKAVFEGKMSTKVDPTRTERPTTDTAHVGAVRSDVPVTIDRSLPLAVGVKHPISFMEFLEELTGGWPELKVIIIARDPIASIRSWRETSYGWQPALDDPKAGLWRRMYGQIPSCQTPLERRAHLWNLLIDRAEEVAGRYPSQVRMLRYEELVEKPAEVVSALYEHIGAPDAATPIDVRDVKPQSRPNFKGFTEDEVAMLKRVCGDRDERSRKARLAPAGA